MASRVVLTFFPILLWKNMKSAKIIKYAAIHGIPALEEHKQLHMSRIRSRTRLLQIILAIPVILFWATIVASLECTPLTGRCVHALPSLHDSYAHYNFSLIEYG